jgi:hypothetical protein
MADRFAHKGTRPGNRCIMRTVGTTGLVAFPCCRDAYTLRLLSSRWSATTLKPVLRSAYCPSAAASSISLQMLWVRARAPKTAIETMLRRRAIAPQRSGSRRCKRCSSYGVMGHFLGPRHLVNATRYRRVPRLFPTFAHSRIIGSPGMVYLARRFARQYRAHRFQSSPVSTIA